MNKPLTTILLAAFALTASMAPAQATPATLTVQGADQEPVTYDPRLNVPASDGSLVPPSELAAYEAWLAAGNEAPEAFETPRPAPEQPGDPVAFETPQPVEDQPGDPIVFGPDTVYVEASDGSLVPESELAAYEAWLAEGNQIGQPYTEPQPAPPANVPAHAPAAGHTPPATCGG